jgi:Protein of unknown function (DUF4199)
MEEKKPISHLLAALVIAAVLIVYSLALYFTGNQMNTGLAWLTYIFIVGGLILFINLYGKALNNQVTFGNLFAYGFRTTAFLALIMIAFTVVFMLLFPEIKEKSFEVARQKMEEQGKFTDEQIEQNLQTGRKLFWVFAIGGIILIYAIVGAISSLIGAAVAKKKPVNPLDQMSM